MGPTELSPNQVTAYESFYREHREVVVRALALTLSSSELGRDAASEGFTRAYERWAEVATYNNPPGWVYRVGYNWAISRL